MNTAVFLKKYFLFRFLILLMILQMSRILFYFYNRDLFLSDTAQLADTFLKSIAFDLYSTLFYFIPYLIMLALILLQRDIRTWSLRLLTLYYSVLLVFVSVLSFIDIFYYRFNLRRINLEALQLLKDSRSSIWHFGIQNPLSILLLLLISFLFFIIIKKTSISQHISNNIPAKKILIYASLIFLSLGIVFYKYAKYLSPLSSSLMVAPGYTGLYANSPQAFIYSFRSGWTYVQPLHFYTDEDADKLVPVFYANSAAAVPNKRNVVMFILESFSYSYLDQNNPDKPYTPFFDSLIQHSTFFTNAYANNITSANGLCSILSGIPSLTNQAFFSSPYSNNPVSSIGLALQHNGYETSFFLGANDDHFGFKKGTKLLGIENYYNGESFPKTQHDGTWGIYDEPFLQYFYRQTKKIQQPFFSVFFTISSHYPFKIPEALAGQFKSKHDYPNEIAVSYVDYAFRHFFDSVKNEQWFQNTVFIFAGDHVSKENKRERVSFNFNSYYHIPVFVFDPQQPVAKVNASLVQHTDIPASIAQLTQIRDTVLSFGLPFYDTAGYRYTINRYSENIVQMIDTNILLQYDIQQNKLLDVYKIKTDDQLVKVSDTDEIKEIEAVKVQILKAYMQQYFNRLYYNKLYKK